MTTSRFNLRQSVATPRRAFTLAELLIVMGLLALLAVLTAISAKKISGNARLASSTNTVTSAMSNARAYAIRNNTLVMVVFRPVWDPDNPAQPQQTEIVFAKWTGLSARIVSGTSDDNLDFFVPIEGLLPKRLAAGIKVAGPKYAETDGASGGNYVDNRWYVQPELARSSVSPQQEAADSVVAVMFSPDGSTVTRNSKTDSNKSFVDFNNNGNIRYNKIDFPIATISSFPQQNQLYGANPFDQRYADDEPAITMVPFIAVFDEVEARKRYNDGTWADEDARSLDLSNYINQFANRIHFNRYTGVVMRQEES